MDPNDELDRFKHLNLTEIMASYGYALSPKHSSRNSAAMVNGHGEKLIVMRDIDGHYVYCSTSDPADAGSVIDFIQRRKRVSLGEVRKLLRPWTGTTPLSYRPAPSLFAPVLEPVEKDVLAIRARYAAMKPVGAYNRYLCKERCIPASLLVLPRFADRMRVDERGNVVFPHFDEHGDVCGFEIRNTAFKGFSPGGRKGAWLSVPSEQDDRLVITEAVIDALSVASLTGHQRTRFLSIGGQMNPQQPALLRQAIERMDRGRVVLAFDNDRAGDAFTAQVMAIFNEQRRPELELIDQRPATYGMDWNDVLKTTTAPKHGNAPEI